jgi:hypothetical protein
MASTESERLRHAQSREHWSKAGGRWTDELVAYALDRFHRRHLRTPTLRELRAGIDDLPSHGTVKSLYGTFTAMVSRHGYEPRRPGAQHGKARNHLLVHRDAHGRFRSRAEKTGA